MNSRVVTLAALLAASLAGAATATAQVAVYFNVPGDTAHAAVPGAETRIQVRARNPYWYGVYYYGYPYITYVRATFVYDATKIQVLGVEGSYLSNVSATPGPGTLTVNATGSAYGTDQVLYFLRVKLLPGVTDGTYLWIKADSADVYSYYFGSGFRTPALGAIGQVCHATQAWGDVDGNGQVDSRDALITLSAAVGLPVSGFNLAQGDVDKDGLTNSRDALLMLTYAIGLDVGGARVGIGVPDVCPGLTAPGDTVVFSRNDAPAGLYTLGASSTVPVQVSAGAPTLAHLAADGRTVAYECSALGHAQICRINTDGTGFAQLTADAGVDNFGPDWSPAGDSIVWLHGSVIWKMTASGSGKVQVGASPIVATGVRWGRTATKLAYANGTTLHVVNTDGTNDVTVPTTGYAGAINSVLWSPAGDSLAFAASGDPTVWVVPVGGGVPAAVFGFAGTLTGVDWGAHGVILSFNTGTGSPPSVWVIRGVNSPIFRVTSPLTFDWGPAWRRSP